MFKPTKQQIEYRQLLCDGFSDTEIKEKVPLTDLEIFAMYEIEGFGEWLYEAIKKIKWKYVARIVVNLYQQATQKKASFQMIELALRVSETYMPTQKSISENWGKIKRQEAEDLKKKAQELDKKRGKMRLVKAA